MKKTVFAAFVTAIMLPAAVLAQQSMDEKKGMKDMNNMDASSMKGMDMPAKSGAAARQSVHLARGEVKNVDPKGQVVTIAHEPVKTLNWPAMTMGFVVKDKKLIDKLAVGKKVELEFVQEDGKYVVMAVK